MASPSDYDRAHEQALIEEHVRTKGVTTALAPENELPRGRTRAKHHKLLGNLSAQRTQYRARRKLANGKHDDQPKPKDNPRGGERWT